MATRPLRTLLSVPPSALSRADRRNAARLVKDEAKRVKNLLMADQMSGAGYPIDQRLRYLLKTCNDERIQGVEDPFTNIWDVVSGFLQDVPLEVATMLRLRKERDHAFSATDFFAFATEPSLQEQTLPRLRMLAEGEIYSFTALGDHHDVAFEVEGKEPAILSGIAMVRRGSHLSWITVGGPICDLAAVTAERRGLLASQEPQLREANPEADDKQIQEMMTPFAVALDGTDDVWLTYAMGLFNLDTAAHEIRILAKDWGKTLAVFSDQFEQRFADLYEVHDGIRRMVDKAVAHIQDNGLYFEIAETAFMLPAYFAAKVDLVTERAIQTQLGRPAGPDVRYALKAPADMRITTRRVATLDFGSSAEGIDRAYTPPRFRVEVDGFWRRLKPEAAGRDRNGQPVTGRTWVKGHARWKDKPPRVGVVLVKSPIMSAIDRAAEIVEKSGGHYQVRV